MIRILCVLVLLFGSCVGQCDDPGCFCMGKVLSCGDIRTFPTTISSQMESVVIYGIEVDSIPSDLSVMFPRLSSFTVYNGKIGRISGGAFANLENIDEISFFNTEIGVIETNAFSNIMNISSLTFNTGRVQEFQESSVAKITNLKTFAISFSNITVIRQNAFHTISDIGNFQIYNNKIGLMEKQSLNNFDSMHYFLIHHNHFELFKCMSMEKMLAVADESAFYENEFSCSCNLKWIVQDQRTAAYLYSNWCVNNKTKVYLDKLDFNEIGCSSETNVCSENFEVTIATEPVQHTPSISSSIAIMTTANQKETTRFVTTPITMAPVSAQITTTSPKRTTTQEQTTFHSISDKLSRTMQMNTASSAPVTLTKTMSTEAATSRHQTTSLKPDTTKNVIKTTKMNNQNTGKGRAQGTNTSENIKIHLSFLLMTVSFVVAIKKLE